MDSHVWQRIRGLFDRAVDLPADERAAFLDAACADEPAIRREVDAMLRADAQAAASSALVHANPELVDALGEQAHQRERDALIGRRVGAWRLQREIGRGGMGAVYLAERDDGVYVQRAAVKLVRAGWDADALLQRFRDERQILATLHHPNIARLLDGGVTEEGKPFLVLEYVDGSTLAAYCDGARLGVAQRLALFLAVCDAVAHAHRSLVVHRDLKPSNILVDMDGQVKLLDFGIAKLLQPGAAGVATATALRAFTPEYAAPEQIQGRPVTTAVDVHALGLLLYELLTGRRPYGAQGSTPAAYEQAILTQEPQRPSRIAVQEDDQTAAFAHARSLLPATLRARLRGDLDAIVLKALRKEPEQRYASVEAMADDVRAYLAQSPVKARRGNVSYHATRFLQRHALATGFAVVALLSLVGGLGVAVWQGRVAREQRDVAQSEARKSDAVVNFLTGVFADADPANTDGRNPTATDLLARGVAGIDAQTDLDSATRSALLVAMGRAHSGLGDGKAVQALMERALDAAIASGSLRAQINARIALASAMSTNSRYQDTLEQYGVVRRMIEDNGIDEPLLSARVDSSTGIALSNLDRAQDAWPYLERAYAVRLQREGAVSEDVVQMLPVSSVVLKALGRTSEAIRQIETSYHAAQATTDVPLARRALIAHAYSLALDGAKRYEESERLCREALDLVDTIYGKGDARTVPAMISWGVALRNLKRYPEAVAVMDSVLALERKHLQPDHRRIAEILVNVGSAHALAGDNAGAIGYLQESLAVSERRNESTGRASVRAMSAMATALEGTGDYAHALDYASRVLPYTEGKGAHFAGPAAAGPRLQHARLLLRMQRMPSDCAPLDAVLAIAKASDAARIEATILAAACAAANGRSAEAQQKLSLLPAQPGALEGVNPYAVGLLAHLRDGG
ncbi:MAG: serine/threonine-protein kinase [Dokdonella sp.]|uniref:serine/threonine-protein kinase n=1 Tax=Dokdonella sp. TaxID=2291710 RepID=UPI003265A4E9